jgi:drug/metabolite transporter (DMT)-like permease
LRVLAALLTPVLFSLSVVCGHRSARLIGGTEANFWRITMATLFLALWACTRGDCLSGAAFPLFLWSGIFGIGLGDVAFFQALPRLGSRLSLLLIECLSAPFGALVEWLWLGTKLSALQVVCGLIILAGVGVALSPGEHLERNKRTLLVGTIFSVIGAIGTAIGAVLSRTAYAVAQLSGEAPDAGTAAFQRVVGGVIVAGICLLLVKRQMFRVQARAPRSLIIETSRKKWKGVWFWIVLNSFFGQTLGVTCMQAALKTTPTGIVLAIIAVTPIVVIPLAYFFEGERVSWRSFLGGVVAVGGVIALIAVSH